ncbi:hypothetical protein QO034_02035 [Sedimentitalea sp. JM2-8]|uniref:Chemotaxis protein CheA n=1 Tax=Sedimentitalea xiamensis TaxID=3050037 RepID=A0ABT7F9T6_9RHOB|nr:hypothetical protein [Sedimentitalea xiamensis]MDK3071878.1 hypothetical protein [Sedimentitalea xiamensis]
MIQNNKILTVSYGTFSCTLEGFDDSFDTMKAIAEYFRDLASDDRYFGAEPPVPDAEMLTRIAQREISRKVEAHRLDGGGFVLRANEARDREPDKAAERADGTVTADPVPQTDLSQEPAAPPATAMNAESVALAADGSMTWDDPDPSDTAQNTEAETPEQACEDVAEIDVPEEHPFELAAFDSNDDEETEAVIDETTRGPSLAEAMAREDGEIPEAEPYEPPAAEVEGIAAKLARIRAVVSRSEMSLPTKTTVATEDSDDVVAENVRPIPQDDVFATGMTLSEPEYAPPTGAEDDQLNETTQEAGVLPAATAEPEPEDEPEESMQDILNRLDKALANRSEDLEYAQDDFASDVPDDMDKISEERDGGLVSVALSADSEEAEALEEDEPSRSGSECGFAENPLQKTDTPPTTEPEGLPEGTQETVFFGPPEPEEQETASEPADNDSCFLTRATQQDARTENAPTLEDSGENIAPREESGLRPHLLKLKRCDFEAALAADDFDDADREQKAAADSDLLSESGVPAPEATDTEKPERDADRPTLADDRSEFDLDANPASEPDTDNHALLKEADDTEDPDLDRLLAAVGSRLEDPENASTHETYNHLRGAIAATEAENSEAAPMTEKSPEDAYRDDLASVVRPRRPTASGKGSDRSPSDNRPAPLQLVADQRVDIDHAAAHSGPVRPRRIATEIQKVAEDGSAIDGNFHEFAAEMGATELPELLEAAAAYLVYVEGRAQFSRPQVMNKVRQIKKTTYNREDGLRSFGRLVRDGKIEKTGGGRFTASGDIGFRPDEYVSG